MSLFQSAVLQKYLKQQDAARIDAVYALYRFGLLGQSQRKRAEPGGGNGWELMKVDWLRMNSQLG
jgi:hypothetical protein